MKSQTINLLESHDSIQQLPTIHTKSSDLAESVLLKISTFPYNERNNLCSKRGYVEKKNETRKENNAIDRSVLVLIYTAFASRKKKKEKKRKK